MAARQALDAIYRRERTALLSYLRCHVGAEAAGDLAQEVFVRAASSPHLLELANPGGFLHRIARNLLIDRARRRSHRLEHLTLIEDEDAADRIGPECQLIAQELGALVALALSRLPERTRQIFAMSRFEDKTYAQIHRELEISVPAVEYHMMKALAHLRHAVRAASECYPPPSGPKIISPETKVRAPTCVSPFTDDAATARRNDTTGRD